MDNANISTAQAAEARGQLQVTGPPFHDRHVHVGPFTPGIQPGDLKLENAGAVENIQSTHADFANLNEYEQTNLKFSLANADLPETGAILNTLA